MSHKSALIIHQFPCLSDNYGYLLHDPSSGETATIDTPDSDEYLRQAKAKGWQISQIWNTHWHPDHAGGNGAIKAATGCRIFAPAAEGEKIAVADVRVQPGETVSLGDYRAEIIDVSGHTLGHIAYILHSEHIAFVGDSLFALGCGRMFEGTPQMMWAGLKRLRALPDEMAVYCAHEYSQANARFALSIDGDNLALIDYAREIDQLRAQGKPTVPTRIGKEKPTNPFLRADAPEMLAKMGHANDPIATFAAIRAAKDAF